MNTYRVSIDLDDHETADVFVTVDNGDNDDSEFIQAAASARELFLNSPLSVVKLNDNEEVVGETKVFSPDDIKEWWA